MKFFLFILCSTIFVACSSPVPDSVLDNCNKQQIACNKEVHIQSCGEGDSGCIKKMLIDSNWSTEDFNKKIKECGKAYQKCVGLS